MDTVKRFGSSHAICLVCRETNGLKTIPRIERVKALQTAKVFIPGGSKFCHNHFDTRSWNDLAQYATISEFTSKQIEEMLSMTQEVHQTVSGFSDDDLPVYTGLSCEQFEDLLAHIPNLTRTMKRKSEARKSLFMWLTKFRKSVSDETIATQFDTNVRNVSNNIKAVRKALTESFVPLYLGFQNLSRDLLLQNTTASARMLHANNNPASLITLWDGTYIYTDKSANQLHQKCTWSGQKKRNFLRPMMCVTSNGYIIDVFGPYKATENDASCLRYILANEPAVTEVIQPGDVFVVDRGFRDCIDCIENLDCIVKMPEFVQRNEPNAQLTTMQANRSRLVTKTRFVVETRNGNIKTVFPRFAGQWSSYSVKYLRDDIRIASAIINKYFSCVIADKGNEEWVANEMLRRVSVPNHISLKINMFGPFYRNFISVHESNFSFVRMEMDELQQITLGTYQLRQAKTYAIAHKQADQDGDYAFFYCPSEITENIFERIILDYDVIEPVLIFVKMMSRFRSRKKYRSFILADLNKSGPSAIISHYCECKHGLRTVGCCSHVATTLFYLCFARHHGGVAAVSPHLDRFFEQQHEREPESETDDSDFETAH